MAYDAENERARNLSMTLTIIGFVALACSCGVGVGGMPYGDHVEHWQLSVAVVGIVVANVCCLAGFVVIERDTARLRRIGDGLRARREAPERR